MISVNTPSRPTKDSITAALGYTPADAAAVGVNLILKSNVECRSSDYKVAVYNSSIEQLEVGTSYTVTICVTPGEGVAYYSIYKRDGSGVLCSFSVSGTDKQIVSSTFTFTQAMLDAGNKVLLRPDIYRFPNDGSVTKESIIHWIKLERGIVPNPVWTPAPEDFTALEARVAALEVQLKK